MVSWRPTVVSEPKRRTSNAPPCQSRLRGNAGELPPGERVNHQSESGNEAMHLTWRRAFRQMPWFNEHLPAFGLVVQRGLDNANIWIVCQPLPGLQRTCLAIGDLHDGIDHQAMLPIAVNQPSRAPPACPFGPCAVHAPASYSPYTPPSRAAGASFAR